MPVSKFLDWLIKFPRTWGSKMPFFYLISKDALMLATWSIILATEQYLCKDRSMALSTLLSSRLPESVKCIWIFLNTDGTSSGFRSPSMVTDISSISCFCLFRILITSILLHPPSDESSSCIGLIPLFSPPSTGAPSRCITQSESLFPSKCTALLIRFNSIFMMLISGKLINTLILHSNLNGRSFKCR